MNRLRVDPTVASQIASAHLEAPRMGDALARGAFEALVQESDQLFKLFTDTDRPGTVRIFFTTCLAPYNNAEDLITSVSRDRLLEVSTVACERDRPHPVMGCERGGSYDRFRAVHDVIGHGLFGLGFDRDGEFTAWRFQERFHSTLARRALATELHGEHSVRWTTGDLPEHKAFLLDERIVRKSRVGRSGALPRIRGSVG